MLNSRFLLRNTLIIERVSACCKCTSNEKPNVIKTLNAENKCIYGKLLETQKQRRKTINKALDVPVTMKKLVTDDGFEVATENFENEVSNKKISKERTRKSKASQTLAVLPPASVSSLPSQPPVSEGGLEALTLQSLESSVCNKKPSKKRTGKSKANKSSEDIMPPVVANDKSIADLRISSLSDQMVLKPSVPINETNYPLENPEKHELFAQDCCVESVLNYSFTDVLIKNCTKFPSVSKIMEDTMPDKNKIILSKWRNNMIDELGEDGFHKHNQALKARGQEFHMAARNAVLGKPTDNCSEVIQNTLKSLSWMLEHISNPMAVESITAHSKLGYKGIPDCVAMFRNVPVVIDWKLSDKPKKDLKDTYEAPVQITAYIGALNHDPNYKWAVNHGLVAVAYVNGDPCDVFLLSPKHCKIYWRHWLMRFDKFMARSHLHIDHDIDEKALEFI